MDVAINKGRVARSEPALWSMVTLHLPDDEAHGDNESDTASVIHQKILAGGPLLRGRAKKKECRSAVRRGFCKRHRELHVLRQPVFGCLTTYTISYT